MASHQKPSIPGYSYGTEAVAKSPISQPYIRDSGGKVLAYFLPTDFAGAANEALGLTEFSNLEAYERHRDKLASDPAHKTNLARLEASGAKVEMNRSIIQKVGNARDGSAGATANTPVERMYFARDDALSRNDRAQAAGPAISSARLSDRRQAAHLGISARCRKRRADGLRGSDGAQRRGPDPAPLRLLGLVRRTRAAARPVSSVMRD